MLTLVLIHRKNKLVQKAEGGQAKGGNGVCFLAGSL